MKNFDVETLRAEIILSWTKEFHEYFGITLKKGRICGNKYWSNRGDSFEVELRNATKYEIIIHDIYDKLASFYKERGE